MRSNVAVGDFPPWNGQNSPELPISLPPTESGPQQPSQQQPFYGVAGLVGGQYAGTPIDGFDANYWMNGTASTINWLVDDSSMQNLDYTSNLGGIADHYWQELGGYQFDAFEHQEALVTSPLGQGSAVGLGTSVVSSTSPGSASMADRSHEAGEFYVDGDAARLPRVKRRKLHPATLKPTFKSASLPAEQFSLAYDWRDDPDESRGRQRYFSDANYQYLMSAFNSLCLNASAASSGFSVSTILGSWRPDILGRSSAISKSTFLPDFPLREFFDHLVNLYLDNFHPILPILHLSDIETLSWQLLLAVSTIGSHYLQGASDLLTVSLHEFTRRLLETVDEISTGQLRGNIELQQTRLLHCVGCLYCGDERLMENGLRLRLQLAASTEHLLESVTPTESESSECQWPTWKSGETVRRLVYSIWLVDTMCKFHFAQTPTLDTGSTRIRLPSHEQVWASMTAREWSEAFRRYVPPPTLAEALEQLYIDKKLLSDMGEFSRILLIHGIFRRTWEVEAHLKQPLSQWTPTAEKRSPAEPRSQSPVWLPSVSMFARWRNSACDCLDILHWSANAAIGLQSGLEHPTVMHLHFARVVLLTPCKNIVRLAEHLSGEARCSSESSVTEDKLMIRRWTTLDQYKARLAMIHAGVLFWHIRRFSANGFYEPSSVGLTVLALWAFSAFSDRSKRREECNTVRSEHVDSAGDERGSVETEEATCDIILIDRPTDDELVQQFVRHGNTMRANMNGVGDLYGARAPEKVLTEGRKLLATSSVWGSRDRWMRILDKLATVSRQRHGQTQG